FQAEDGIRDPLVTGVQTCALPILLAPGGGRRPTARELRDRLEELAGSPEYRSSPTALASWLRQLFPDFPVLTRTEVWTEPPAAQIGRASCRERVEIEEAEGVGVQT